MRRPNAQVSGDSLSHLVVLNVQRSAEIEDLVGERDLERQEGVGHVFCHFRLTRTHDLHVRSRREHRQDAVRQVPALRRITDDLTIRPQEVRAGIRLAEKLWAEKQAVLGVAGLKRFGRAWQNSRFDDDGLRALQQADRLFKRAVVEAPLRQIRRRHTDEDHVRFVDRLDGAEPPIRVVDSNLVVRSLEVVLDTISDNSQPHDAHDAVL